MPDFFAVLTQQESQKEAWDNWVLNVHILWNDLKKKSLNFLSSNLAVLLDLRNIINYPRDTHTSGN